MSGDLERVERLQALGRVRAKADTVAIAAAEIAHGWDHRLTPSQKQALAEIIADAAQQESDARREVEALMTPQPGGLQG